MELWREVAGEREVGTIDDVEGYAEEEEEEENEEETGYLLPWWWLPLCPFALPFPVLFTYTSPCPRPYPSPTAAAPPRCSETSSLNLYRGFTAVAAAVVVT